MLRAVTEGKSTLVNLEEEITVSLGTLRFHCRTDSWVRLERMRRN